MTHSPLTLTAIQEQLAATRGRDYWRGLEELAETPEFQDLLQREFPRQASEWLPSLNRRRFLQLMGASLALAGLAACAPPTERIVPYVQMPEESLPGKPLFFATAMSLGGFAQGVLVESHENRPTKIEGNPDHPASLGATDALTQASILDLYDPNRAQTVTVQGQPVDWPAFLAALQEQLVAQQQNQGAGLRILTETITSPTLYSQLQAVLAAFPQAVWHQYEAVNRDTVYAGAALAFGAPVEPIYRFDQAQVILSLDADFWQTDPGRVRYARDFATGRRAETAGDHPRNRLYAVESTPTLTGAAADHRLPIQASQIAPFARALAAEIGLSLGPVMAEPLSGLPAQWIGAVARDLLAHAGTGLVVAGLHQPPAVHALVHALNERLGNVGRTVLYTEPVVANPQNQMDSLAELTGAMAAGEVQALLILGGNPFFQAPADLDVGAALKKVGFRVHLSLHADETAALCDWHLPQSHYLESWGDVRAYDGTITIQQPLIAPLYASRTAHEVLDALLTPTPAADHDLVKGYWQGRIGEKDFDAFWQRSLHDGVVAETALPPVVRTVTADFQLPPLPAPGQGLELNLRPDPSLWDGRFANNGWLQELPKPLTKLTWENAALLSPLTAERLGLANGDRVTLTLDGRTVEAPVWLLPGHCEEAVSLHLGYGRDQAGRVATGAGVDAYRLRTTTTPWFGAGLTVSKVSDGYALASTQLHHSMEGRNLVRAGTLAEFAENPGFAQELDGHHEPISLYPQVDYPDNAWGMAIDLNACIGCNACVTACQSENNIPVVGKEQVLNGREMHWIRLDRYYQGDPANPQTLHQPVMCMHCENAPCEVVCPVAATLHDHEGLNTMVYNRCVGTRYCANNCPYKVRRFNFLQFTDLETESIQLQRNPNVTVRSRGVMEKCTYCVQRISAARISAKLEGRPIRDGEVVTACQGACPTQAIAFGNLNDPASQVAQRKTSPLNYGMLTELNTHPRTTYLARLRNPNPELAEEAG